MCVNVQVPKDFVLSVAEQRDKLSQTYRNYRSSALAWPGCMHFALCLTSPECCLSCDSPEGTQEKRYGSRGACSDLMRVLLQEDAQHVDHFMDAAQDHDTG